MKASGRMTEALQPSVTNWNSKLSWQTKIYSVIVVTYASQETQVTQIPRAGFSWPYHLPRTHLPRFHTSLRGSPICLRILTVCGGCQPHLEESYRVCSRTATGDAWPSEILASLPLPAGERGDDGINILMDSMSFGKREGNTSKAPTLD